MYNIKYWKYSVPTFIVAVACFFLFTKTKLKRTYIHDDQTNKQTKRKKKTIFLISEKEKKIVST